MTLDGRFQDQKERDVAVSHLRTLLRSRGWQILLDQLKDEEQDKSKRLKEEKFEDVLEVSYLQQAIKALEKLQNLPTIMIEYLMETKEGKKEEDLEIY